MLFCRLFSDLLNQDLTNYPSCSGALSKQTFGDSELTDTQRSMEATVSEFLVDDSIVAAGGEDGEDDRADPAN